MSEIYAVVGSFLITFGAVTSSYFGYRLHQTRKSRGPIAVLLSETLATVAVGILQVYCYCCCNCPEENFPQTSETGKYNGTTEKINKENQNMHESNSTLEKCEDIMECLHHKMLMEQIVISVAAIHCFLTLITSSTLCKKFFAGAEICADEEPSTSSSQEKLQPTRPSSSKFTAGTILTQWLLPLISILSLYFVISPEKSCDISTPVPPVVTNFQNLVSEILERPINVTEKSVYETEINTIVDKVYSIIESATENDIKETELDEGFEMYNIIERMNSLKRRKPKELKPDPYLNTAQFKIYTIFFMLFSYFVPLIYSSMSRMKLKLLGTAEDAKSVKNNVQDKVKYLQTSIVAAAALWTPSFMEMFARTYITQTQPTITTQILLSVGSLYMLLRNGINLKLLKAFVGHENSVQPKV